MLWFVILSTDVVFVRRRLLLSYGTGVRMTSSYEVLVSAMPDAVSWVRCKGGNVPPNSVIGGIDCSYLEPIYVGRTLGSLNEGKTWRGQRLIDVAAESVSVLFFNFLWHTWSSV